MTESAPFDGVNRADPTADPVNPSPHALPARVDRVHDRVGDAVVGMLVAGPPDGPVALLLHGVPTGAELFRDVVVELANAGYRAIAADLPGYGGTRLPAKGDRSIAGAANLFAAWMRQEQLPPVWLIGHDFGGMVGQILAVRHPQLLARMTIGNTAYADSWPVFPIRIFRLMARLRLFGPIASAGIPPRDPYTNWVLRRAFADASSFSSGDRRQRIFFDTKFTDPVGRREFEAHLRALDNRDTLAVTPALKDVRVPTLILWGAEDRYQPWATVGRRLAAAIPGVEVRLIDGAGHFAMLDKPLAYTSALLGWGQPSATALAPRADEAAIHRPSESPLRQRAEHDIDTDGVERAISVRPARARSSPQRCSP